MNKWFSLMVFMVAVLLNCAAAQPIPAGKIFRNGETQALRLSPNAQLILGAYVTDESTALILRSPNNHKSYQLLRFAVGGSTSLARFAWVDNNTVMVFYSIAGIYNPERVAIIDFDINAKTFKPKLRQVDAEGFIVDYLPHQQDKVLFAIDEGSRRKPDYRLYTITTSQLTSNEYKEGEEMPGSLDDAWRYIYDKQNNRLMGITLEIDRGNQTNNKMLLWYRELQASEWLFIGEIKIAEHEFSWIGVIDNDTIAVLSNETTDFTALVEFNIKSRTYGKVLFEHKSFDLTDASLKPGGQSINYVRYRNHGRLITQYFGEKAVKFSALVVKTFPNKQFYVVDERLGHDNKIVYVYASDDPGQYYLYDHQKSQMLTLGKRLPGLEGYSLAKTQVSTLSTPLGHDIELYLTRPQKNANQVLLVMPHGGPIGVREVATFARDI
ncbi:MAG: hypothetical protein MJK04_04170 [Psychrosphaera sp.]|nr:hypothetical protein [Psychrosphaera sp.]